ncbi:MerR family transcriptional regulator [Sphingomonas sp. Leaf339]|uniref:MerR family transcriptional regulator n=1 Tax=Sphingomonas sp. Leaf339 TaxID=1736343 RepID=UPI000701F927|nr:MerR family transcriptional regulator [Sphingomonas sp. Leaf339]KQU47478.1 MerR family transcriptional regulator [Sphingomonas sp. Leaf339]
MEETIDITEVASATGLTPRALRFYEARGLVRPLRTAGGRRIYGRGELAWLHAVVALKRAGFTLTQITGLLGDRRVDLARLITAQLAAIDARAAEIAEARALLLAVQSRLDRREPIDVATLCSLIRQGDTTMTQQNWQAISDRYLSDEAKADFARTAPTMPEGFDQASYAAQWTDLASRIEAALPLDPASDRAGAFFDEWQALLAPFTSVATPAMMTGVNRMYGDMDSWKGEQKPPFPPQVWAFITSVGALRRGG